jgi:hypothetical protein
MEVLGDYLPKYAKPGHHDRRGRPNCGMFAAEILHGTRASAHPP